MGAPSRAPNFSAWTPLGELTSGDSGREADVILDPRARSGLAAGSDHIHSDCLQAFRGPVDGGCQASRSAADDDEVEEPPRKAAYGKAKKFGQRRRIGLMKNHSR